MFNLFQAYKLIVTVFYDDLTDTGGLIIRKKISDSFKILIKVDMQLILFIFEDIGAIESHIKNRVEHFGAVFQLKFAVIFFELTHQSSKDVTSLIGIITGLVEIISFIVFGKLFGKLEFDLGKFVELSQNFFDCTVTMELRENFG